MDGESDDRTAAAMEEQNSLKRDKQERELMMINLNDLVDKLAVEYFRAQKQKVIDRLRNEKN
jgi:hypothetical protein